MCRLQILCEYYFWEGFFTKKNVLYYFLFTICKSVAIWAVKL